jgi:hypothetical protein
VRERLVTLGCALAALLLFIVLFVDPGRGLDRRRNVPRPTTEEVRGNGYHAAYAWLAASHLRTVSLRDRFDTLFTRGDLARAGNVLVVTLPGTELYRIAETRPLQRWIRAGNTLLVLAALADAPDWATVSGGAIVGDLKVLSGLDFASADASEPRKLAPATLLPNLSHAYFAGVGWALAASPHPEEQWTARLPYAGFMLSLAHERATGNPVLWTSVAGEGRIVVCALGSLFTDNALGLADNAQLLANIIGANLAPRGAVIFDDFHQGLSTAYDPQKFYSDPKLYLTGLILLGLWFVWVLGATRLRTHAARVAAPREADLVRANGAFLARVLANDAAARLLFEHLLRRLAQHMPQSSARGGPWEYLHALAHLSSADLAQLERWHTRAFAGERVPLVRLYNLIRRIEMQVV